MPIRRLKRSRKLHVDVMHVQMKDVPKEFDIEKLEFKDQWGITKKKIINDDGSFMYNLIDYPLRDAQSVDDILSYKWPAAEEIVDVTGLREQVKQLYNDTDFALTATFGGNVFERPHYLRGMDNFFMDLMINPEIAEALMDKVLEIEIAVDNMVLQRDRGISNIYAIQRRRPWDTEWAADFTNCYYEHGAPEIRKRMEKRKERIR